jgi:murein DD-endopeptidase MepM/ murein hydrolase activator NlpD
VKSVAQDDLMGTTVIIDHGNGLKSIYSNLAATPTVSAGDSVDTGTVIGAVGDTAIAESERVSHLHFEMTKNGTAVDPSEYLP